VGVQFLHLGCQEGRLAPIPQQLRHWSWGSTTSPTRHIRCTKLMHTS